MVADGRHPSTARWRWGAEAVELRSSSGQTYLPSPDDIPVDVVIGLLALRDVQQTRAAEDAENAAALALRSWMISRLDPMLTRRSRAESAIPAWTVYRHAFLTAVGL